MSRLAVFLCIALGIALRTIQYRGQVSLWLDELALMQNVIRKPLLELVTRPLDYQQVSPAGFLALERIAFVAAGPTELALRCVPWIASIVALLLFWRILADLRRRRPEALTAAIMVPTLALFAVSPALIAYAGQAKQYASDVAAVLAVVWAGIELLNERPRVWLAVLAGAAALLISAPAVLAGAAIGCVLVLTAAAGRGPRWATVLQVGACWTPLALLSVFLARYTLSPETAAYMQDFWARGFLPPPWDGLPELLWTPRVLKNTLGFTLFWFASGDQPLAAATWALAVVGIIGVWWLVRHDGAVAGVLIAPIVAALVAAAARQLPIDSRVSLWLGPPLLLVSMFGVAALRNALPGRLHYLPAVVLASIALMPAIAVVAIDSPPYRNQDMRPLLQAVAAQAQPDDEVYVYFGARQAMRFYGPPAGLTRWTEGACHRGDTRAYYDEVDQFRGRPRVWFIWTHALPRYREPDAIRSYLETIGRPITSIDDSPDDLEGGAQAVLYDLSDPARLASATAASHPVPAEDVSQRQVPCAGPGGGAGTDAQGWSGR